MSGRERYIVGIFSRSSSNDYSWLVELLTSEYFRTTIREVRPCYISNNGFQQFMNDLSQCTFGILYHTKNRGRVNITDVTDSLYDEELEYLNRTLGKDNVLVVVDDLEDSGDQEKTRILDKQPSIGVWASDLLLISHTQKADKSQLERILKSIMRFCHPSESVPKRKLREQRQNSLNEASTSTKSTIAVFSISEEGHIQWLRRLLSSDKFGHQHVTFHSISLNDDGDLGAVEFQCKVAVLYHTMQRGGFPNTPHGESLYHKVLQRMSEKLGKENVVMIIDDVQGGKEMMRVKRIYSDIERLVEDLCLILHEEKEDDMKLVQKLKAVQQFCNMSGSGYRPPLSNQETSDQSRSVNPSTSYPDRTQEHPYNEGYRQPLSNLDTSDQGKSGHPSISFPTRAQREPPNKESLKTGRLPEQGQNSLNEASAPTKPTITVFSISEEGHIKWLRRLLSSEKFGHQQVTFHSISQDDDGWLGDVEFQGKVAVLYHTMQSGGFPDTPHGESLYHKVLQQMSEKLGKENVVMIIDDVQGKEMMRVKKIQSDIERLADLCPILHKEKEDEMKPVQKLMKLKQFHHMSEHPPKVVSAPQTSKTLNKTPTSRGSIIGIFSVSEEGDIGWLRRLLSSDTFGQREVAYHKMPSNDNLGLEEGKPQCAIAILYHTMKTGPAVTPQGEFLYHKVTEQLVQQLGKDNVIVLIDDLKSVTDRKWAMLIQSKIEKWAGDLLYIPQEEKHNQMVLVQILKSLKLFHQPPDNSPHADFVQLASGTSNIISDPASFVIGVFSCSEKSKSTWLYRLLSSEEFGNPQVKFQKISPANVKGFQSMVSHCKFGILYHCMDRGYQPLTDLENSLYDEELKYLSTTLGKCRVIVVIDEVGNIDEEAKSWTLEKQPSLGRLARDILLFSKSEKTLQEKPNRSMPADRDLSTLHEKLNTLKEILKEGMTSASFSS